MENEAEGLHLEPEWTPGAPDMSLQAGVQEGTESKTPSHPFNSETGRHSAWEN